jgi:NAD(P)-dependent dehydrogenase (short-subunit alcohol dehydrogenase family)
MTPKLDKHIAILGGSSGIGLATARLAAERGARITLGGRDRTRLNAAADQTGATAIPVDAEDRSSLAAVAPLARELAPRRVNAVSPGVIVTEWWDSLGEHRDAAFDSFAKQTPLGRNGRPEEVASAILALIDNPFITGVVLPVDGGIRLT